MMVNIFDLLELLRIFELLDFWKDARDAPEGTTLHRWRYVVQGLILLIAASVVLGLPLWLLALYFKP
ncbi:MULTISPECIES: hypothetical protein [Pseudomonas syringae group]|uniref:Uncharacterized protein n=1 Tax=Pseudomonas savastanoi TaxID=29438 RepID=A0AAW3M3M7_PSESS|nr:MULTISPECIES: hypothetical protein [Pseudomonas syringae group]KTC60974.1 hypothetical protein AO287_23470 [Pseudomonas savastanoi]MDU8459103.1 hypothetical protein [Pseudomonas syringae group sp. J254-4]MDU8544712.1 hypothetical protein [Pseudomonas syringae group sp. J248-6]